MKGHKFLSLTESQFSCEDQLQAAQYMWFHNTYPQLRRTLFAVPNGAKMIRKKDNFGRMYSPEASKLKGTGLIGGPSDLIWVLPDEVLFIENKYNQGTQTDEQLDFEAKVTAMGWQYILLNRLDTFQQLINSKAADAIRQLKGIV